MTDSLPKPVPKRDKLGKFRPGSSGNARGRPPRAPDHFRLAAKTRNFILTAANRPVVSRNEQGEYETITFFEANVLALATGNFKDRRACTRYIKTVLIAAASELPRTIRPPRPDQAVSEKVYQRGNEKEMKALETAHVEWHRRELLDMSDEKLQLNLRKIRPI